ncbi:MAG: ATP-binding cassette domain-containing protein [Muribaculaceae bacterium]|nr:ATP-binding cassette domain-containing protein [Muribaculaceae bacterium]
MKMSSIIQYNDVELLRKEHVVLKHVGFSVEPGEFVYLIGAVGSGKSTLLKSLYGEVPVSAGEARVFDYDLTSLRRKQVPMLRRRVGIVFQDFQLLMERNVYANLDFVLRATGWKDAGEREERIDKVLAEVGMANKSYKMPHELSGGEQQRIVIARALLNSPDLILADEPTGNLDPATGEQIIRRLYDISQAGTAVVVATHNLSLLDQFPGRVLRCANKKIEVQQ